MPQVRKPLDNLKPLRRDMQNKGWAMQVLGFPFKSKDYFAIVRLYQPDEHVPKLALCEITFLDRSNLDRSLITPANTAGLMVAADDLRKYFDIEKRPNYGDLLRQFTKHFGQFIPLEAGAPNNKEEQVALVHQLSKSDSEDPSKIYCFAIKRNPTRRNGEPGTRSAYNDNKARLLRPNLYAILKGEPNYSFCFSADYGKERSDAEILGGMKNNSL